MAHDLDNFNGTTRGPSGVEWGDLEAASRIRRLGRGGTTTDLTCSSAMGWPIAMIASDHP